MNRRQFLIFALASVSIAAGVSIATSAERALAYRPIPSNGISDGGNKRQEKRRKRRG